MKGVTKYELQKIYSNPDNCLELLFKVGYGETEICPNQECQRKFKYYRVKNRRCYECGACGNQIYPIEKTIFRGLRTDISVLFNVLIAFSFGHNGVSANSISKNFGLTYKTAFKICNLIRSSMSSQLMDQLTGVIEIDETYVGGRRPLRLKEGKKGIGDKMIVFGMLQRKGRLRMFYVKKKDAKTIRTLINKHITLGSVIHHDNNGTYGNLEEAGFLPKLVRSKTGKEFRKGIHNNNIETRWATLKNNILAIYVSVSKEYFQRYLDEYSFRYEIGKGKLYDDPLPILLKIFFASVCCEPPSS